MAEKRNLMRPAEQPEIKPASTITSRTIKNAYIFGDRKARRRIEEYGRVNRQILREMIVHEPAS